MNIGFIGLGKLGLPCAVATALKGHVVRGYDCQSELMSREPRPYHETGPDEETSFNDFLRATTLRFSELSEVVEHSEIVFIAVQTPHRAEFEGMTRLTSPPADFDYTFLTRSINQLAQLIRKETIVVIISTVLPGTLARQVMPHLNQHMRLVYNPFFIAMGTTMRDFLHPEFHLLGAREVGAAARVKKFYGSLTTAPVVETSVENAELIKLLYNTFIGMKIGFANLAMEICQRTPQTNVDEVTGALQLATRRLISGAYLSGGMGDGGGCHPRDNIAMSWFARELDLSYNWFEQVIRARERQTEWLAQLMCDYNLPKAILGYAFKAESRISTGSPALLLRSILEGRGHEVLLHDPLVEGMRMDLSTMKPMVFMVGARHSVFKEYRFPQGSVVLDPWRYLQAAQEGVRYVPVGIGPDAITA